MLHTPQDIEGKEGMTEEGGMNEGPKIWLIQKPETIEWHTLRCIYQSENEDENETSVENINKVI